MGQAKEKEFQQTVMVTATEASEVQSIAAKAGGKDFDINKLPADAKERLSALYTAINQKVGYAMPESLGTKAVAGTSDSAANKYVEAVNAQLDAANTQLQQARLAAFAKSFS